MSSLSNILNPTNQVFVSPPSIKSLGKRRAISPSPLSTSPGTTINLTGPIGPNVIDGKRGKEKRITRSSLGGNNGIISRGTENNNNDGLDTDSTTPPLALPLETSIFLTLQPIPNLILNSIQQQQQQTSTSTSTPTPDEHEFFSENVAPTPSIVSMKPSYRVLDKMGDSVYGKSRHVATSMEADTSDAHYRRLHRYPEVLEKRSTRLERDKLIHERSKLILEIEEMKSRSWVYYPQGSGSNNQGGGTREDIRRQRIQEKEERLQRYDALLPNQPRKSGALSNTNVNGSTFTSNLDSRGNSPALLKLSTPNLSASPNSSGATSMRIKFKGSNGDSITGNKGKIILKSKRSKYLEMESEDDQDDVSSTEEERKSKSKSKMVEVQSKPAPRVRDRRAERERAKQRAIVAAAAAGESGGVGGVSGVVNSKKRSRNNQSSGLFPRRVRQKQIESFYASIELRNSLMDAFSLISTSTSTSKNRRASSRLSYAFGQRVPKHILAQQSEFELHGGGPGEKLEDMVLRRTKKIKRTLAGDDDDGTDLDEEKGEEENATRVFGGVVVPASAMTFSRPIVAPSPIQTANSESSLSSAVVTPEPEEQEETMNTEDEEEFSDVELDEDVDELEEDQDQLDEVTEVVELVKTGLAAPLVPIKTPLLTALRTIRHSNRTEKVSYVSQ